MYCNGLYAFFPIFVKMKFVKKALRSFFSRYTNTIACIVLVVCLAGCTEINVYEKNVSIPKQEWSYHFKPAFEFNITDTASNYGIYVVLRHTDAYRYNNIWLNVGTRFPGDTIRYQRLELSLGTDANGWEGTGMDDIWEVRKPITKGPVRLPKAGNYTFTLEQIMREDPLGNILSAGIRVEKIK